MKDVIPQEPLTWAKLKEQYEAFEQEQRASGKLWKDIGSITDWVIERIAKAEAELAAKDGEIERLNGELAEMTEDRDLWKDDHNNECPNAAMVATLEAQLAQALQEIERLKEENRGLNLGQVKWNEMWDEQHDQLQEAQETIAKLTKPVTHDEVIAFQAKSGHSLQAMTYACIASGVLAARQREGQ